MHMSMSMRDVVRGHKIMKVGVFVERQVGNTRGSLVYHNQ